MQGANSLLNRLPVLLFAVLFCGYAAFNYYEFLNSPSSALGKKRQEIQSVKQSIDTIKTKVKAAEEFYANLEGTRAQIRENTLKLEQSKASLASEIDMAGLIQSLHSEAKKLNLKIKAIRPEKDVKNEFYTEFPFSVELHGAYIQMLVFFDRLLKLQQMIGISDFSMKPAGDQASKYVELSGVMKLVVYKYVGGQADEVAKKLKGKSQ